MSNGSFSASILASRRGGDVLIADDPIRIEFVWADLRSADGDEIRLTWIARVACVDSPADRALLAERFFVDDGATSTLAANRASAELGTAMRPAILRAVSKLATDALIDREVDGDLKASIEAAARSAAFGAGLAVLPPFELTIRSPSREREHRLSETRDRLAALAQDDAARARSLAEVTRALTDAALVADVSRADRILAGLRLADPLDVLRATAIVDPAWSIAEPSLWIAAGTRLAKWNPSSVAIALDGATLISDTLGPIRSVSAARVDGTDVLLVGARDGVHVAVLADGRPRVVKSFRHVTGVEFGFNAVCFLNGDRTIVATHSRAGVVAWNFDDTSSPAIVTAIEAGARSAMSLDPKTAVLIADGRLATFSRDGGVELFAGNSRFMSVDFESRDGAASRRLIREDSIAGDARYGKPVGIEDEIEVAGVPRVIRTLAAGGLEMTDSAGSMRLQIGPATLAARSVAARPGFVAAMSVDRTRVSIIDLSRPEVVAVELHVAAALGSRVADVCFA